MLDKVKTFTRKRPFLSLFLLFILTLPVTIITLGLFTFVLNALMILLVSTIVKGFTVEGFVPALLAALLLWVISLGTNWLIKEAKQS